MKCLENFAAPAAAAIVIVAFPAFCALAENLIPDGARNWATTSGAKVTESENMHEGGGMLFNGVRDRWLGKAPNSATAYYPSEKVTFTTTHPFINAYRVLPGVSTPNDRSQGRQATTWELYGSNDGGATLTLLHAQTEPVQWYDGKTLIVERVDCIFDNATPYSTYLFRVTGNGGDQYASVDDVEFYRLLEDDMLTVEHNGFEVGVPSPGYGPVTGLKAGDTVELSVADLRAVDPATSHRYELRGFTITDADGTVLHEGLPDELPYRHTHGARGATVVWNWADLHAEFVAAQVRQDLTVPENAAFNEITDGKMDGSPVTYYNNAPRATYGPQKLFDNGTGNNNRWLVKDTAPYYAQYVFKQDGEVVPRMVTGLMVFGQGNRPMTAFDFEASNDGLTWTTLLSVSGSEKIISGTWDFEHAETYSRYRLVVQAASQEFDLRTLDLYCYRGSGVLEILGQPAYGRPDPDYGFIDGLSEGRQLTLTAPLDQIVVSEDEKALCTGYTLAVDGAAPVDYGGTTCAYVHSGRASALTWKFARSYRQRVAVRGAGSVDCGDSFFAQDGARVTITATPRDEGEPFLRWDGDVPAGQAGNPVLSFTVDRPRSLTAVFAAPTYVSVTGDDANDGASWAMAVRTVARAWELSGGAGKVCLGEGEFAVRPGVLELLESVSIEGRGMDLTTLAADNSEGGGTLLAVGHDGAVVTGVRVKGAVAGSASGAGIVLSAGTVTGCCIDSCSTDANAGGVLLTGTGRLVDSVVTNCTAGGEAGGVYVSGGAFLRNTVTDCRAPNCGGACFMSETTVADSTFSGNEATGSGAGGCGGAVKCNATGIFFTNCVFRANVARRDGGVICACPRQVTFEDCLFAGNEAKNACGVGMTFHGTIRRSRLVGSCGAGSYGGTLDLRSGGALENSLVTGSRGGAGVVTLYDSDAVVRNCTVVSNRCATSGAVLGRGEGVSYNSIFAENYSGAGDDLVLSNWTGSAANALCCCVQGYDPSALGTGSIAKDPRLAGIARGDFTLTPGSPCVNAGSNDCVTEGETDLLGHPRIRLFGGKPKFDVVDMGCYESPHRGLNGIVLRVD